MGMAAPAPAQVAPRGPLDVHVAQAKDFSRIELHWAGGARAITKRDGQVLTLKFNRDANPDIARLRIDPPKWLKTAEARHSGGGLELVLTLAEDAEATVGNADGATYINLFERPPPPDPVLAETAAPIVAPEPPRANPVPTSGVVAMDAKLVNGQVMLTFPWANPNGAAVFRRGDAIWVVFDAPADLDVSKAPRGLRQFSKVQSF